MEPMPGSGLMTGMVLRGRVVHVAEDGWTTVVYEDGGDQLCELLQTGPGAAIRLEPGDPVLVWRNGVEAGEAVILGRIGRPAAEEGPSDELVIEARKNLTLKCGDGSITIREDGKILIKGKDLVSHAKRVNRIKGGSVAIN